ncbi:ribosome assembly factor SBDS [Candidatus Woesearchaeota archaeon]|nr:ribosome assembly factor SBDS [Candidatus Woesearchaeota archaeon]
MVSIDDAVVAKLKIGANVFEILVDCEKALELRKGKDIDLDDILATNDIFKDLKKGEHASDLLKFFKTENKREIARKIIMEGEVQLTSEYKNKLRDEKRKQIINNIHRNAVDPNTGFPHPPRRIESALEEAKINIDEFKPVEEQLKSILPKLRVLLPLKYEIREIAVKIPSAYAGKCYTILKQYGNLLKDEWQNDGSLVAVVEIPAGLQEEFFDKLNGLSHGEVESKILNVR